MFTHVVMFTLQPGVDPGRKERLVELLKQLGAKSPHLLKEWRVVTNTRYQPGKKLPDVVQISSFESKEVMEIFNKTPEHASVVAFVKEHCDWQTVDGNE